MYKNTIMLYRINKIVQLLFCTEYKEKNHKKIRKHGKHVQNSSGKWLAIGICEPRCGFQRSVRSPMVRALDIARRQAATPSPPVQRSPMRRALEIARRQTAAGPAPPPVQPVTEQDHPPCYMVLRWTEWQPGGWAEGRDGRRVRFAIRQLELVCPECGREHFWLAD